LPSRRARAKAIQLREAALRGDDTLAAPAIVQPAAPNGEDSLLLPLSIPHVRRAGGHATAKVALIMLLLFIALGVVALVILGPSDLLSALLSDYSHISFVGLVPLIRPLFFAEKILFVPFILEGFAVLQGSRFHVVSVDDRSIHWRRPGSRQQAELLPWREAKVFVVVRESAKSASKST
jgi:hypothetical protein